ncbi:hypothetical protein [Rhodococcus chondri]|uniref:Uncharacterized protein n=1 Tax=Rhodococcus chondri TaxID=3065941 RepID=A0ABU7JVS4_9NOCA|nr:hypothetical protein [Rhodococcus sp. CC-R104]MEE2033629.1 hypothetical protein [Rhodococcus sp. CC-R104]
MNTWPDHYPVQCPPDDARPAAGVFYRLVDELPPVDVDAKSHLELKIEGHKRFRKRKFSDDCIAAGLSIFGQYESVVAKQELIPALRDKKVARGDVSGPGLIKQTGQDADHHTWWRPAGDSDWGMFEVVA